MSPGSIIGKSFLIILSLLSFLPQIQLIRTRRDCSGLSLIYMLFNLIVATEQFSIGLHLVTLDYVKKYHGIVHDPPTAGDWLNLCQFGAVWLGHTILTLYSLRYSLSKTAHKWGIAAAYLMFLLISLGPVGVEATLPPSSDPSNPDRDRRWFAAFFATFHLMFVNPVVTIIGLASVFPQARAISSRKSPGSTPLAALSLWGLALQAIVFTVVGISWLFRLTVPKDFWQMSPIRALMVWYQIVGWAAVDNLIFAFVQAVLYFIAYRHRATYGGGSETAPLLH